MDVEMLGIDGRSKSSSGKLADRFGEAGVWIEPADNLDGGVSPLWPEDMPDDWLVEMPDLPPGTVGVPDFDLEAGDNSVVEVKVESVGLSEADSVGAAGAVDEPARGNVSFPESFGQIGLNVSLIAIAGPSSSSCALLRDAISVARGIVGELSPYYLTGRAEAGRRGEADCCRH